MWKDILINRIRKIVSFLDDKKLSISLEKNLEFFSVKDLEKIFVFLEKSDYSMIYDLLEDKRKEYEFLFEKINILKWKIKLEKNKKKEELETAEENVESLINF